MNVENIVTKLDAKKGGPIWINAGVVRLIK